MGSGAAVGGTLYFILLLGAIVVLVLWILLPFALFGLKPLVRELIAEMRRTRETLERRLPLPPPK